MKSIQGNRTKSRREMEGSKSTTVAKKTSSRLIGSHTPDDSNLRKSNRRGGQGLQELENYPPSSSSFSSSFFSPIPMPDTQAYRMSNTTGSLDRQYLSSPEQQQNPISWSNNEMSPSIPNLSSMFEPQNLVCPLSLFFSFSLFLFFSFFVIQS